MAEFVEVIKQWNRMHRTLLDCGKCPISAGNNDKGLNCHSYSEQYPQEAEEIIMKWAKEHSIKTNADKFKEVFGFEPSKIVCPKDCKGKTCSKCDFDGFKWWHEEYVETKEQGE